MSKVWQKEEIMALIEAYRDEPCLYVVTHPNYHHKRLRQAAMERVVSAVRVYRPTTDPKECQSKWNNLRNTFNQENAKRKKSMKSGVGESDVYQPQLWYFNLISFIESHVQPRKSMKSQGKIQHSQKSNTSNDSQHSQNTEMQADSFLDSSGHMIAFSIKKSDEEAVENVDQVEIDPLSNQIPPLAPASPDMMTSPRRLLPSPTPSNASSAYSDSNMSMPPPSSSSSTKRKRKLGEKSWSYAGAVLRLAESLNMPYHQPPQPALPTDPVDSFVAFIGSTLKSIKNEKQRFEVMGKIMQLAISAKTEESEL